MIKKSFHHYFRNDPNLKDEVISAMGYYRIELKDIKSFYHDVRDNIKRMPSGVMITGKHTLLMVRLKDDTTLPLVVLG
jgi:hypothetical protein